MWARLLNRVAEWIAVEPESEVGAADDEQWFRAELTDQCRGRLVGPLAGRG